MFRKLLAERGIGATEFRWRGHEISRVEGFSDAVFAFAVTLLVVSLEVPETFHELVETMKGFFAFAVSFAMLIFIWYKQYIFFRRYALHDTVSILLNATLIFVVLFYVYPLKFLFTLLAHQFMGTGMVVHLADGSTEAMIRAAELPTLMSIYSGGYVAIFTIFFLLYLHAWRKRTELALDEIERFDTWESVTGELVYVGIGVLSLLIAVMGGPERSALAGWVYVLLGPVFAVRGRIMSRRRAKLAAKQEEMKKPTDQVDPHLV